MFNKKKIRSSGKKVFGFLLLALSFLLPGTNGKQIIKNKVEQFNINNPLKEKQKKAESLAVRRAENLITEEEHKEIEDRLKGLGYFN